MAADLRERLRSRVLVLDGAMGTLLLAGDPDPQADLLGAVGCPDALTLTRPERVTAAHEAYLAAGCDAVETNTFLSSPLFLERHGLAARARELNETAARLARAAADRFATPERPRFVLGSVGPGARLPSLGEIGYAELRASYREQVRGLVDGGADALLFETCQDPLQAKAAVRAGLDAREASGRDLPILVSLTMEVTGAMRVGTELEAALAILDPLPVDALLLNCATGPREMGEHVRALARGTDKPIGVYPNAGLPHMVDGRLAYPLGPRELADWLERFVLEDGLALVGGCCGTTPAHMATVAERLGEREPRPRERRRRTRLAGLRRAVEAPPVRVTDEGHLSEPLLVGALDPTEGDAAAAVALARRHLAEGCDLLALELDALGDPRALVARLAREVDAPLCLTSARPETLDAALEVVPGRALVGPVRGGGTDEAGDTLLRVARAHGAAVRLSLADERDPAQRSRDPLRGSALIGRCLAHGFRPQDLFLDPIAPASLESPERGAAGGTLGEVIEVRGDHPDVSTWLDVGRVAAGLPEAAALAVQAVFLHFAARFGLTAAVLGPGPREPIERIDPEARELAQLALFEWREPPPDRIATLLAWCEKRPVVVPGPRSAAGAGRERARPPAAGRAPAEGEAPVPEPPFLGPRVIESLPLQSLLPYVDQDELFGFHWGHGRGRRRADEHRRFLAEVVRPQFFELAARCEREGLFLPRASYGYFRCVAEGDSLALLAPDGSGDVALRLRFPRQTGRRRLCVADLFQPVGGGGTDVVALQVVTLGHEPARAVRAWYAAGDEEESRRLQGFATLAVEALAELVHRQVRGELGIAGEDAREPEGVIHRGYRGCRYTFGEPACPPSAGLAGVLALLRADELGVGLDAEGRLAPAHSSAAVVCHRPGADFFTL